MDLDFSIIVGLYDEKLKEINRQVIFLNAENMALRDELEKLKGGDCCGKADTVQDN
jgi:hypothetical protein